MRTILFLLLTTGMLGTGPVARAARAAPLRFEVSVEAGAVNRQNTVVSFPLPLEVAGKTLVLRNGRGALVRFQTDDANRGAFILDSLRAGTRVSFFLEERASVPAAKPSVEARTGEDGIQISVGGRPVLRYQSVAKLPRADIAPEYLRNGYIHPVFTPSGIEVTDDYPGNHLHHHGIWFSWAATEFEKRRPNFWDMGKKTGRVSVESVGPAWSGVVHGGVRARHIYSDLTTPQGKTALREAWRIAVYKTHASRQPYWLFDLESTTEAAGGSPVTLRQHIYGGLGMRGHAQWDGGEKKAFFVTSEGKGRIDGHATAARWCHMGGLTNKKRAGIAVLGHPANQHAPQPMRIHPTEPFFCFAPTQAGAITIEPGRPLVARYRFVISDGPPDRALLERAWRDFAEPPAVTVRPAGGGEP